MRPLIALLALGCAEEPNVALTDHFGGILWNIANTEWTGLQAELAALASDLEREFHLTRQPVTDPFSLDVRVHADQNTYVFQRDAVGDPTCEDCFEFHEARNSITFNNFVPSRLDVVSIEYIVLGELPELRP